MFADTSFTISYTEACAHAEDNHRRTNGMVCGGGYMVRFDNGTVGHVDLRIDANGMARPV